MLTAERVREALHYDPETGVFTWRIRSGGTATAGSLAGHRDTYGYMKISLHGGRYYAHRLAFLYMTGAWPRDQVDHANRDRGDNSWMNLREADQITNARNTGVRRTNRLGVKGVSRLPGGSFQARIYRDGRQRRLGCFPTIEAAAGAYARAGGVS